MRNATYYQKKVKITCIFKQKERLNNLEASGVEGSRMKGGKMDQNN